MHGRTRRGGSGGGRRSPDLRSRSLVAKSHYRIIGFWAPRSVCRWTRATISGSSIDRPRSTPPTSLERHSIRLPPSAACPAPNILEFDQEGNLVGSWGGPGEGYDWPQSNHGITVDAMDNVWIGGNGAEDSHILKFTRDGAFLMQVGQPRMRAGSNDREHFWRVAEVTIDEETNEGLRRGRVR